MQDYLKNLLIGTALGLLLATFSVSVRAQEDAGNPLRQNEADPLTGRQSRLADRYDRLELLAGRLAELSRATQPSRARLLRELVTKSRERDVAGRFDAIIGALQNDSLGKASKSQVALQADLQQLLELLLQEDRDRQIESERKRINKYLAELKRLIRQQRGIRARTEGGDEAKELTDDQQRVAESTGNLEEQIQATEGLEKSPEEAQQKSEGNSKQEKADGSSKPQDKEQEGQEKADGNAKQGKPAEEKSDGGKPSDGQPSGDQPKPNESNEQGKSGKSQRSQGEGEQSAGSPSQQQDSQQSQSPAERAQQRLRKAQQRMKQAQQQLEEAKQDKAVERQEQAIRELEQAKAELERILRQLREEELERMLVLLEARFRKMLNAQVEVYEQTKKLAASQATVPEHEIEIASGRLGRQESQIVREADRALVLLREDGTTVAFPEAIEQARDDMKNVAKRLGQVKIGALTQGLEEDIIAALEETLAALQQALKQQREQKSQPSQQQQGGKPGEKALVDQLAELRMIRALQNRINRRTLRYGEILGDDFAVEADLLEALDELSIRQERIFEATRDLDTGRNQ